MSPQFHYYNDDFGETAKQDTYDTPMLWAQLVGLMAHDNPITWDKRDANAGQHVVTPLVNNTDDGTTGHDLSEQGEMSLSDEQDDMA